MIDPVSDRRPPVSPQLAVRVATLGVLAFVLFAVIFFRLWYLQVLSGDRYVAQAQTNKVRNQPIPAPRGTIVDRDNKVIVRNRLATVVSIKPESLPVSERKLVATYGDARIARAEKATGLRGPKIPIPPVPPDLVARFDRLGRTIGLRSTTIQDRVVTGLFLAGYAPIKLKTDVPDDVSGFIAERQELFPGVTADKTFLRSYKYAGLAAQLLGNTSQISPAQLKDKRHKGVPAGTVIGQSGIEARYDKVLRGRAGKQRLLVDAQGNPRGAGLTQPPTAGNDLQLTLSLALQQKSMQAFDEVAPGKAGAFLAMDPGTGEVLAMQSYPTFDPNVLQGSLSQEKYDAIFGGDISPQFDRVIGAHYATGSTFKIVTALGALSSGKISTTEKINDTGCIAIDAVQRRCNANNTPYGPVDMRNALRVSSDVYFYTLGERTNSADKVNPIQRTARSLGFERPTGIDIPGEERGLVPDPAWRQRVKKKELAYEKKEHKACCLYSDKRDWSIGDNISLAIGQGDLQATPLQLATAYSALATGGRVPTPRLGMAVQDDQGTTLSRIPPGRARRVRINAGYRGVIMDGLHDAASAPGGTSTPVFGGWNQSRFPVFGKTGTAQVPPRPDQSWYVAYSYDGSPSHRPIVIAVTVEDGGFGAETAAPIACRMLRAWFGPKRNVGASCSPGLSPTT